MDITLQMPFIKGYVMIMRASEARFLEPAPAQLVEYMNTDSPTLWIHDRGEWHQAYGTEYGRHIETSIVDSPESYGLSLRYGSVKEAAGVQAYNFFMDDMDSGDGTIKVEAMMPKMVDTLALKIQRLNLLHTQTEEQKNEGATILQKLFSFLGSHPDHERLALPWKLFLITLPAATKLKIADSMKVPGLVTTVPFDVIEV